MIVARALITGAGIAALSLGAACGGNGSDTRDASVAIDASGAVDASRKTDASVAVDAALPRVVPDGRYTLGFMGSKYSSGDLTIAAPDATLVLTLANQGTADYPNCTFLQSQVTLRVHVENGSGGGAVTYEVQETGSGCRPEDLTQKTLVQSQLQIYRTAGTGTGFEDPSGTWQVIGTRPNDVAEMTFQDGAISGTLMNDARYSYSASLVSLVLSATNDNGGTLGASMVATH